MKKTIILFIAISFLFGFLVLCVSKSFAADAITTVVSAIAMTFMYAYLQGVLPWQQKRRPDTKVSQDNAYDGWLSCPFCGCYPSFQGNKAAVFTHNPLCHMSVAAAKPGDKGQHVHIEYIPLANKDNWNERAYLKPL